MNIKEALQEASPFFTKDRDTVTLEGGHLIAFNGAVGCVVELDGFDGVAHVSGAKLKAACAALGPNAECRLVRKHLVLSAPGSGTSTFRLPLLDDHAPPAPRLKRAQWHKITAESTAAVAALSQLVASDEAIGAFQMDVVAVYEDAAMACDGAVLGAVWRTLGPNDLKIPGTLLHGVSGPAEITSTGRVVAVRAGPTTRWSALAAGEYPSTLLANLAALRGHQKGVLQVERTALLRLASQALAAADAPADVFTAAAHPHGWFSLCGVGSKHGGRFDSKIEVQVQAPELCHCFVNAKAFKRVVQSMQSETLYMRFLETEGLILWDDVLEIFMANQHQASLPVLPWDNASVSEADQ